MTGRHHAETAAAQVTPLSRDQAGRSAPVAGRPGRRACRQVGCTAGTAGPAHNTSPFLGTAGGAVLGAMLKPSRSGGRR